MYDVDIEDDDLTLDDELFIFEENTEEYNKNIKQIVQGTEEVSSVLGANIYDIKKTRVNTVQAYNVEKFRFLASKGELRMNNYLPMEKMEEQINSIVNKDLYSTLELDLYNALYKSQPVINSLDTMKEPYDYINKMIRNIVNKPEMKDIKSRTTFNSIQSLMVQNEIYQTILDEYEKQLELQQQKLNNNNNIEMLKDALVNDDTLTDEQKERYPNDIKELENANNFIDNSMNNLQSQPLDIDYNKINEDMNDLDNLLDGYGVEDSSQEDVKLNDLDKKTVANIMSMLNDKRRMKKLLDTLGVMKDIAVNITKKNISKTGFVPVDVITGNKINKLVPSEKLLLAHKDTKRQFYKKYGEKQLLEYETQDIQGRGPIIVCRDVSGSMLGPREIWACAISLSVLQSAKLQKRDVYILHFNRDIKKEIVYLKNNSNQLKECIELSTIRANGGTDFNPVFKRIADIVKMSRFKKASILMLTDGDGNFNDDIYILSKKLFKNKDVDMRTIFIGSSYRKTSNSYKYITELSKETLYTTDKDLCDREKNSQTALNIFDAISK